MPETAPSPKKRKKPLCDNDRLSLLVKGWQVAPERLKAETWALFVTESADWLRTIICDFAAKGWNLSSLGSAEDIRAELLLHLYQTVLPAYRPAKGRLFSFVTFASQKYIRTLLDRHARFARHYVAAADYAGNYAPAYAPEEHGAEPEVDGLGAEFAIQPEVYSSAAEIREVLDRYATRNPEDDEEYFLVRNVVVLAYDREGKGVPLCPTIKQLCTIVQRIVHLPQERALSQTTAALAQLRKSLENFRGRPSLYCDTDLAEEFTINHLSANRSGSSVCR